MRFSDIMRFSEVFVETKSVTKSRLHCTSNMMPHDVNALVGDGFHSRKSYVSKCNIILAKIDG